MSQTTVSSGETYPVSSGQTDTGDIVLAGGMLDVLSGGTIIGTLNSGGTVAVFAGGTAIDTTDIGGTVELVGGVTSNTTLSGLIGPGGTQVANEFVHSNGSALDTTVNDIAVLVVGSGGIASGTIVNTGGHENVDGGLTRVTAVNAGGFDLIYNDGVASSTIVNSGAEVVEGTPPG
jgi:autotransporter passenger strand-loop-strand repeat protein